MNPARVFCLLAAVSFVYSCFRYWRYDKFDGDRFLFLSYSMVILGFIALLRGWGL